MELSNLGCQTCKARHLKCDKTLPVCQRCEKSRRICHRARAVIHIENEYANRKKKRPRGPRSNLTTEKMVSMDISPQNPSLDLKSQAIAYYLRYHLSSPQGVHSLVKTQYDTFVPIWRTKQDSKVLDLCISSMALAVFAGVHHYPPAAVEATSEYQRLLQAARNEVVTTNTSDLETCLLASFFMGRYEDMIYQPDRTAVRTRFVTTLRSAPHHDGALAILKACTQHSTGSQLMSEVAKHSRRGLLRSAIMRDRAIPEWMVDGSQFGEEGLDLAYDSINVRIVNVRQRVSALHDAQTFRLRLSEDITTTAECLDEEARTIDKMLQDWIASFPDEWMYTKQELPSRLSKHFYSTTVYSYSTPITAGIWSLYFANRMLINSTRWRILRMIRPESDFLTDQECLDCMSIIQTAANDLAATLPSCLQRYCVANSTNDKSPSLFSENTIVANDSKATEPYIASLAVWPLTIASSLGEIDVRQKLWFRSELADIGRLSGARVLECAETDRWLEL